jgi:hypothetical protein
MLKLSLKVVGCTLYLWRKIVAGAVSPHVTTRRDKAPRHVPAESVRFPARLPDYSHYRPLVIIPTVVE